MAAQSSMYNSFQGQTKSPYCSIVVLDPSGNRPSHERFLPQASRAFDQFLQTQIPELRARELSFSMEEKIQNLLLTICWQKMSSSEDILALLNSSEGLLLRVRFSHFIFQGCRYWAKRFASQQRFGLRELCAIALTDEGKDLDFPDVLVKATSQEISQEEQSTTLGLVVKFIFWTFDNRRSLRWLIYFMSCNFQLYQELLTCWVDRMPYTVQFLLEDLDNGKLNPQQSINLAKWMVGKAKTDWRFKQFVFQHGIYACGSWSLLNEMSCSKLEKFLTVLGCSVKIVQRYSWILSSYHDHYRNDPHRNRSLRARLEHPNERQLQNMTDELATKHKLPRSPSQLLQDLEKIAQSIRTYYLRLYSEGWSSDTSMQQPVGNDQDSSQKLEDLIADPQSSNTLEQLDSLEKHTQIEVWSDQLATLWEQQRQEVPRRMQQGFEQAFQREASRKGQAPQVKAIFYYRVCKKLSQTKTGERLGINQGTVSRNLEEFYLRIFKHVQGWVTQQTIRALYQEMETWETKVDVDKLELLEYIMDYVKSVVHGEWFTSNLDLGYVTTDREDDSDPYRGQLCRYLKVSQGE